MLIDCLVAGCCLSLRIPTILLECNKVEKQEALLFLHQWCLAASENPKEVGIKPKPSPLPLFAMKHLLQALDCPFHSSLPSLDALTVKEQGTLVCWLEDRVIRELDLADRDSVRPGHAQSIASTAKYLKDLGCPFPWTEGGGIDALHWLVSYAVNAKHEDDLNAMEDEANEADNLSIFTQMEELGALLRTARHADETNTRHLPPPCNALIPSD